MAPLWFSSYVLHLRVPEVSLTVENIADFISAYIIGNLLQMAFRFWAFRRWVFPDEFGRDPDKALESAFTAAASPRRWRTCTSTRHVRERHPAPAGAAPSASAGGPTVGLLAAERVEDFVIQQRVDAAPLAECRGTPAGPVTPTR